MSCGGLTYTSFKAIDAKTYPDLQLTGISRYQFQQHYHVYTSIVEKLNQVWHKLQSMSYKVEQNQPSKGYRSLKVEETRCWNGVKLHELYFGNLGQRSIMPPEPLMSKLIADFGCFCNWKEDFNQVAQTARSWVVLACDLENGRLLNLMLDGNNVGCLWRAQPLLALDVEDHAYTVDFGTDRQQYLKTFWQNIDWETVNKRFSVLL